MQARVKKDFYAEIPVSIKVAGNYHNVGLFFDKVSRLSRIVNIKDITARHRKLKKQSMSKDINSKEQKLIPFMSKV